MATNLLKLAVLAGATLISVSMAAGADSGTTTRISVNSAGAEGDYDSNFPSQVAANGKIAFTSKATNLVNGDNNQGWDTFVYDINTRTTERVSTPNWDGTGEGNGGWSDHPHISGDGTTISFHSQANNLVENDNNGLADIFVRKLSAPFEPMVRANLTDLGAESNDQVGSSYLNGDGTLVIFDSSDDQLVENDSNMKCDVFIRDIINNTTKIVSVAQDNTPGDGHSEFPSISKDGQYAVFASNATTLIPGGTNGMYQIFRKNLNTGEVVQISVATNGAGGNNASYEPSISADGSIVAFVSRSNNLSNDPDLNGLPDIFVRDLSDPLNPITERVNVHTDGTEANGFSDMWSGSVSDNGRFVVFSSSASNLVLNDTNGYEDIFVHNRQTGVTERVSVASDGTEANGNSSFLASISGDGRYVSFESNASNLVPEDNNGAWDVFVHVLDADGDGYPYYEECLDSNKFVNPGAIEVCKDGVDNDCNPSTDDTTGCADSAEICNDGVDNDGDGTWDCGDDDCKNAPYCVNPPVEVFCDDGSDNDGDGTWDCGDDDCKRDPYCVDPPVEVCTDGVDNDGDGTWDCGDNDCKQDPYCANPPVEICTDGVDNDGDNLTDCADKDCKSEAHCPK